MKIKIPENVEKIIENYQKNGFEAYCVGGCVRDSLLLKTPSDWDIATSALPSQTKDIFPDTKIVETGIKHGTLTLVIDKKPYEVTTFRVDGDYLDSRHPQSVAFTRNLRDDLSRRDFTMNAIACNNESGTVDYFGGTEDIYNGIIRTVGDPEKRFTEDALRILRAMRFSSVLGFEIEAETAEAIHKNRDKLKNISKERLADELTKLLCGKNVFSVLMEYPDVLAVFIPEIADAVGFRQYGKKHCYDVWEHICHTVDTIPPDKILRLTMFLHDLGKMPTHKLNENGDSTFKNHAAVGGETAKRILTELRYDKKTVNRVSFLVGCHDFEPAKSKTELKMHLKTKTPDDIRTLLTIKKSDRGALSEEYRDISSASNENLRWLEEIEENDECCTLKQLAIRGSDLTKAGISGEATGKLLEKALDAVIEGKIANKKADLLTYIL